MAAADGAVVKLLQAIYDYVHEDPSAQAATQEDLQNSQYYGPDVAPSAGSPEAFQEAQCSSSGAPAFMQADMLPYMQQPYTSPPGAAYHEQQPTSTSYSNLGAGQQGAVTGWPPQYPAGSMQYPMSAQQHAYSQQAYAQAPAQYAQQSAFAQQPMGQYTMQHMQTASTSMPPHQMAAPTVHFAGQQQAYELGHSPEASMPSIEYDKRPRAVDYKPYTLQDYSSRNFDAKRQDYWKLGTLGPQIEDEDLQVNILIWFALSGEGCQADGIGCQLLVLAVLHSWVPNLGAKCQSGGEAAHVMSGHRAFSATQQAHCMQSCKSLNPHDPWCYFHQ